MHDIGVSDKISCKLINYAWYYKHENYASYIYNSKYM